MEISTPDQLAQPLNLHKDGRAAPISAMSTLEGTRVRAESVHQQYTDPPVYSEEFASQYLPSLVHSFLELKEGPIDPASISISASYTSLITLVATNDTPSFPRFTRGFPDKASALCLKLTRIAVFLLEGYPSMQEHPDSATTIATLLETLVCVSKVLSEQLPTTSAFPSLPPSSQQALRTLTDQLLADELPNLAEAIASPSGINVATMCFILRCLVKGTLPRGGSASRAVWWSCELSVGAVREGRLEEPRCLEMQEGQEMMACSKCLAVRYCSKEHQKADWKRHKRFCFKPTW